MILFLQQKPHSYPNHPDWCERDEFVDQVFESAGMPLVHVRAQATYNTAELAAQFQSALRQKTDMRPKNPGPNVISTGKPPLGPQCGVPMVVWTARKGNHVGREFYGCPNYPRCRVVVPKEERMLNIHL